MKFSSSLIGSLAVLSLVLSACGNDPAIVEVPGDPHAQILSFSVTPGAVDAGGEVTAQWTTKDATGIELTRNGTAVELGDASVADGSMKLVVQEASVFVLKATGKTEFVDTQSASVAVNSVARPNIVSFTANPATVRAGETTTLAWQTKDTDTVRIVDASGAAVDLGDAVASEGSVTTAALAASTSFKLIAERTGQPASERTVSVTVTPLETTRIVSFTAEPAEVDEGGASRLSWVTENAGTVQLFAGTEEIDLQGQGAAFGSIDVHPTVSGTYRLVASKAEQTDEKTIQVRVKGFPTASFGIAPSPIDFGGSATATWSTEEAETVSIADAFGNPMEGGSVDASGSRLIHPSMTTTFTLTATGPTGKVARVTDIVEVRPAVLGFSRVDTEPVGVGDVVELTWETGGATSVELSNLDGATKTIQGIQVDEGSASMPVGAGGQFEIVAKSGRLETRSQIQVVLVLAPAIGSFQANRDVVSLVDGSADVRLAWSGVNRADTLELDDSNLGRITLTPADLAAGFKVVTIEEDTTFTLTARNSAGFVSSTADVRAVSMPTVSAVSVFPDYIGAGEEVELSWTSTGATNVVILANGMVVPGTHPASGTASIPVSVSTTFEVQAFNDALDSVSDIASVSVGVPQILTFTASDTNAWNGTPITFDWTSRGAGTLSISQSGTVVHSTSTRTDAMSGSFTTPPLTNGLYDFELEIRNAAGAFKKQTIRVRVGSGPSIESFTLNPAQLLSGTDATVTWSVGPDPDGNMPTLALTANLGGPFAMPSTATGTKAFTLTDVGTYQFTLTATTTPAGSIAATQQATTTVFGTPAVTLSATPSVFDDELHADVELAWTSVNADTSLELFEIVSGAPVSLLQVGAADRASGSFHAGPQTDARTFRIVATNGLAMTAQQDVTVTMQGSQVLTFTATPTEVYANPPAPPTVAVVAGDAVDLTWTTKRATQVNIDQFDGLLIGAGAPYVDITTMGATPAPLMVIPGWTTIGDEGYVDITFPTTFTFPFRGSDRTSIRVFSNGVASFDMAPLASSAVTYSNGTLGPTQTYPFAHVCPFWDDLYNAQSAVSWLVGSDPISSEQFMIIQWKGVTFSGGSDNLNFQAVLFESGEVELRYGTMSGSNQGRANGNEATIGVNAGGTNFKQIVPTDTAVPGGLSNKAFRFSYPPSLPLSGTIPWVPSGDSSIVTRTARLTASGMGSESKTVSVQVHPKATVTLSTVLPAGQTNPTRNTPFALRWTTTNATGVTIVDEGGSTICTAAPDKVATGSCNVTSNVTGPRVYTAVVTGGLGHEVRTDHQVAVISANFAIVSFDTSAAEVNYGQPVTLYWETGDADDFEITANGQPLALPAGIDFNDDSFTIPSLTEKTTFVLTITNTSTGTTRTSTKTVSVRTFDFTITPSQIDVPPGTAVDLVVTGTSFVPGQQVSYSIDGMNPTANLYQDISADPDATRIIAAGVTDDNAWALADFNTAATGFSFPYFGQVFEKMRVSIKGFTFPATSSLPATPWGNQTLPTSTSSSYKDVMLVPYWGDLLTGNTGAGVFTKFVADPVGGDHFIIQWHKASIWGSSNTGTVLNFQIVMFSTGAFEYRYGDMLPVSNALAQGGARTIGYQAPGGGGNGATVHYGGVYSSSPTATSNVVFPGGMSNRAFGWAPTVGDTTLTVTPGATTTYKVCASVQGFSECKSVTVTAEFNVTSFDPSAMTIDRGQVVDLSWVTKNADTFTLSAGSTVIATEADVNKDVDTLQHMPDETTTYTLKVHNNYLNKDLTSTKTVTVKQFDLGLTANLPPLVSPGDPVTLTWTASSFSGAPTVLVTPLEEVTATSAYSDISGAAGVVELVGAGKDSDVATLTFDNGFTFPYLGTDHVSAKVSTDGFISFDPTLTSTTSSNVAMPSTSNGKIHLAPFWDNLRTLTNGRVLAAQVGSEYVIQWSGISMNAGSTTGTPAVEHNLNFQVVLHTDGSFEYRYGLMAGLTAPATNSSCFPNTCDNEANGSAATIGYQNGGGTAGYQLYFGGGSPASGNFPYGDGLSNRSFRFTAHSGGGSVTVHPYDTTAYRVCAISGTYLECSQPVSVPVDWKIVSFAASPRAVPLSAPVTLDWTTVGADSLNLYSTVGTTTTPISLVGYDLSSDSYVDLLQGKTTYKLEIVSKGRIKSTSVSVDVQTVAVSLSGPASALAGEVVTLNWNVSPTAGGTPAVAFSMFDMGQGAGNTFADLDLSSDPAATVIHLGVPGSTKDDEIAAHPFPAGFSFPYMGTNRSTAYVAVNGVISFDSTVGTSGLSGNGAFPTSSKVYLAPFWDDLKIWNGKVLAKQVDADTYVIQWSHVSIYTGTSASNFADLNFMVVLKSDGSFEYRYGTMAPTPSTNSSCAPTTCVNEVNGSSATIGYQDPTISLASTLFYGGASSSSTNPTFPGGLSNRTFRFEGAAAGSKSFTVQQSGTFTLCAQLTGYKECKSVTIVVPAAGDFIVTEIMLSPAGGAGQWFEIRNLTKAAIDIEGWEIETDVGTHTITQPLVVQGGGYVTISTTPNPGFTPTYVMSGVTSLGTSAAGHIGLNAGTVAIGELAWDASWVIPLGASLELDVIKQARIPSFTDAAQFCATSVSYDGGTNYGTPGQHGLGCGPSAAYAFDYFPSKPAFDISVTGTSLPGGTGNAAQAPVPGGLGFQMPYFGGTVSDLSVSVNGFVSFGAMTSPYDVNRALGTGAAPLTGVAAPFWVQMSTNTGSDVKWERKTVGGQSVMIVQWIKRRVFGQTGGMDFQVQLWQNGDIVFAYLGMDSGADATHFGSTAVIGIEDVGAVNNVLYSFKTANAVKAGQTIMFMKR